MELLLNRKVIRNYQDIDIPKLRKYIVDKVFNIICGLYYTLFLDIINLIFDSRGNYE